MTSHLHPDSTPSCFASRLRATSLALVLAFTLTAPVRGDTVAVFTNLAEITNPQIDASTFVNFGRIIASNSSAFVTTFPFQTLNTLNYTNAISGSFFATNGSSGFQFEFITNTSRFFANHIVNQGTVEGDSIYFSATNLINSGSLIGGTQIQLRGTTVNLSRSVLAASGVSGTTFASSGFRTTDTNGFVTYQNPSTITDVYWGAGTGNVMTASSGFGNGLDLIALSNSIAGFIPPNVASPSHEVQSISGSLGAISGSKFIAGTNFHGYARTNRSGTNVTYQVVLVQTNTANTNLAVDVRFASVLPAGGRNFFTGITPMVRFSTFGSDITTGTFYTNNLYFLDYLNSLTNTVLSDSLQASSSRPAAYELSRGPIYDSTFASGSLSNTHITNIVYHMNGFELATVTNNPYAAYQVAVGTAASSPGSPTYIPHLDDPTNFPGRVDISANNLDMSLARIRADGVVTIRATNLISSAGTIIDAPFIQLNIANTNSTLTLTNFATTQVARPSGTITFYSTTWTNSLTNTVPELSLRYHVLIVDASQLTGTTPVTLQEFSLRGTNVVINNVLNIGRSIEINSPAVTFSSSSTLNLPPLVSTNLLSTNFPNVNYFTNFGTISVPYQCALGSDRATALSNFVNRGTLTANSIAIRALEFESTGTNLTRSIFSLTNSGGGPISILANSARFEGGAGGGLLSAGGSILLAGNDFKIRNHLFTTAGTLVLSPTNSLSDTGTAGTNRINVALGFSLTVKPASGDLLGTTIYTTAPFNRDVPHVWAGTDFGPVAAGYTNNAAVGRLLIDTGTTASFNRLSFAGIGASNALYVDYLDLAGTITNDLATHLFIDTNMVLYFANANLPAQSLDGQLGGRLRWVKDYAGPNTGVDVRLADGRTVKVNVAKLNSQVLDSDADGIVNGSDLSPFDGIIINSRVAFTNVPPLTAFVTWEAAAQTVYQVEINTNLLTSAWQFLANFTNSAVTNRLVTFPDVVPTGGSERYYRILYQP